VSDGGAGLNGEYWLALLAGTGCALYGEYWLALLAGTGCALYGEYCAYAAVYGVYDDACGDGGYELLGSDSGDAVGGAAEGGGAGVARAAAACGEGGNASGACDGGSAPQYGELADTLRGHNVRFCRYRFAATDLNSKATWFGIQ
jgi:hypothetical protein